MRHDPTVHDVSLSPNSLVAAWVAVFNRKDVDALAAMYAKDAVNHQVAAALVVGRRVCISSTKRWRKILGLGFYFLP